MARFFFAAWPTHSAPDGAGTAAWYLLFTTQERAQGAGMSAAICSHPIAFETLVAYWAGDLSSEDEDAVELHVMGCARCTASSERVAAIALSVRALIPPLIAHDQVAKLRARGVRIEENAMVPGERKAVVFRRDVDVLLHRLGGLDLANASDV